MDIRAVNFVATVIGWCVLGLAVLAALAFGISEVQANTSDVTRGVLLVAFVTIIILGGLYFAALDWFRDRDKDERWLAESHKADEQRHEREVNRVKDELFRTRQALFAATEAKPKEQPRVRTKPKQ
jgi:hypothetical protein